MIPLSNLAVLEFQGDDARQFLQNQLSADIDAIAVGQSGFACCCNPAGRVLALLLILPLDDRVLAVLSADLAEDTRTWLNRFILRSDVRITARNDLFVATGGATDIAGAAVGPVEPLEGLPYAVLDEPFPDIETGPDAAAAWKAEELRRGVCWLDSASAGQFLPQMLGFEAIGALNFRKGCFPGQEVIARTRYLGKLKRRPLLLQLEAGAPLPVMQKVTLETEQDSVSGVVVDEGRDASGRCLMLVVRSPVAVKAKAVVVEEQRFNVL